VQSVHCLIFTFSFVQNLTIGLSCHRKFTSDDLPAVVRPEDQEVRIDAEAVVTAIRDVFAR
jgi:hypothetical protein